LAIPQFVFGVFFFFCFFLTTAVGGGCSLTGGDDGMYWVCVFVEGFLDMFLFLYQQVSTGRAGGGRNNE